MSLCTFKSSQSKEYLTQATTDRAKITKRFHRDKGTQQIGQSGR